MVAKALGPAMEEWYRKLYRSVDDQSMRRVGQAAGMAGKKSGLEAVVDKLGADRSMSGMRRKAPLGVGFDSAGPTSIEFNFRPGGLWKLADQGRRKSGKIYPRNGSRRGKGTTSGRAVRTPYGFRASSSYGPSRGTGVLQQAKSSFRTVVPRAAFKQLQGEIARSLRG